MTIPPILRTRLGARIWIACIQFFIAQCIVASAWRTPYSNSANFISDLGAATCGYYPPHSSNYVCSPWHSAINVSMTLQGCLFAAGAFLWLPQMQGNRIRIFVTRLLIALAGLGSVMVGIFPEDVASLTHYIGAALHIVTGNLGLVMLGFAIVPRSPVGQLLRVFAFFCGGLGILATCALSAGFFSGLGIGGMERVAVYPLPICLMIVGLSTIFETSLPRHPQSEKS